MPDTASRAIAVVAVGAVMPDAPSATAFWENIRGGRYSISEVPPDRWDPALYWDPDPKAPDKTYSKIGGWVRAFEWDPLRWHLPIPPRTGEAMDDGQKWAISCVRELLASYGYPGRPIDGERTAVILGNAMGGEKHYKTSHRIFHPEVEAELRRAPSFLALPEGVRASLLRELRAGTEARLPEVYEDTMPGELSNCIAGRLANLFNLRGPNYVCDAACASALAAMSAAVEGLVQRHYDAVIAGGVDRNMGPTSFVKFCKIGALSATGTRPYADGADGFVMGEGTALFLLKRLADAERDGDTVLAVIRGIGGSSDGKGKGITAPNPVGQVLAVKRGWEIAGLDPKSCSLVEGHGTSTRVGDVVELQALSDAFGAAGMARRSIPVGSVKSNIGHLKAAAGAAGVFKAVMALHHKLLPPSLNFTRPNPSHDWEGSPFFVNTEAREWAKPASGPRRAGVSAFGFGGTNFHVVLEEHVPGALTRDAARASAAVPELPPAAGAPATLAASPAAPLAHPEGSPPAPLRGALVLGAQSPEALAARLVLVQREASEGRVPPPALPRRADLESPERIAIDYGNAKELAEKAAKALRAHESGNPAAWKALRAQGIFRGSGPAAKAAFLFTGQGSQYVNMGKELARSNPVVRETFAAADRKMAPILGRPLTDYIYVDTQDEQAIQAAEEALKETSVTQPAVLALDVALANLLASYGVVPDFVMGHSLGEYGALVASGVLPFEDALEAVAARGREMTKVSVADNGKMAAVFAPVDHVEQVISEVGGYVVIANYNSRSQQVIGGATEPVKQALSRFRKAGVPAVTLHVSHAFHTAIVAPASGPFRSVLERLRIQPPHIPVVANVSGEFYPSGPDSRPRIIDLLAQQVASPVRFSRGLETLYAAGARVFVEVGPKKAIQGFADDVLGDKPDAVTLATNHPKAGDAVAFNHALCGFYAAGLGRPRSEEAPVAELRPVPAAAPAVSAAPPAPAPSAPRPESLAMTTRPQPSDRITELGLLFAEFLERGMRVYKGEEGAPGAPPPPAPAAAGAAPAEPVVVSGASLGLPGRSRVFDDGNVGSILRGESFIGRIPDPILSAMATKHVVRLVKSEEGESRFEAIDSVDDVIKLAGRGGALDLAADFGVPADRIPALDVATRLAIGAGLDALRDAGIPLVMRFRTTTKGTKLPERWALPEPLQDDTGVLFASAFPGYDSFAERVGGYHVDAQTRERLAELEAVRGRLGDAGAPPAALADVDARIAALRRRLQEDAYVFDRRFLFRILAMGHSQFAELIGARGPNTQVNSACASTSTAVAIAEDWIRAGRCRRVLIVTADDATSDRMMEWIGAGFLATGAAATDEKVEDAALPFDRRRHGMVIGMGAAALVVEEAASLRERGIAPACRILSTVAANSAYHGTRLDVSHISQVMETLVGNAERRWGIDRHAIAPRTVFVSHETYTPARGGSASAEVFALRNVFGPSVDRIVMANTKGFTGHPMAVGIEDVVAVKILETGLVPPIPNFREVDPELGALNLSKGGAYDVDYAIRLAAGFGSQISMTLLERVPAPDGRRHAPEELGYLSRLADPGAFRGWLDAVSGYDGAEVEVERRTLRVRNQGPPTRQPRGVAAVPAPVPAPTPSRPTAGPPVPVVPPASVAPPPVASEPTLPAAPVPAAAPVDPVAARVLSIVAQKTGYPSEMLALDLDLEADLGIDTVKQAELFSAVREEWGIPRDDSRKLRDYPTLAHVIQFVRDMRPDLPAAAAAGSEGAGATSPARPEGAAAPAALSAPAAPAPADPVQARVLSIVAEKTGYPSEMLALDLDLEADLGIDTVKQAELFSAVREEWGIPRDDERKLRDYPTLGHVIQFVRDMRPDLPSPTAPAPRPAPSAPVAAGEPGVPSADRAPAPEAPAGPAADPVLARVLSIVTEKTGYPADMLDPELDLEADLGIDTVKQAELFSAVREEWGIPRDDERKLRDYPTLAHVVKFVHDNRPDLAAPSAVPGGRAGAGPPETVSTHAAPGAGDSPAGVSGLGSEEAAAAIARRVPVPVVRPPLAMCKPTAASLGRGSRVAVMPDRGGVGSALAGLLGVWGASVLVLDPHADAELIRAQLESWSKEGPIAGIFWLPALDDEGDLRGLDLAGWREALRVRVKLLYAAMRALDAAFERPGTFLVSATRMGGHHGYDPAGATAPLGGAVTGFTKAFKRERTAAVVKAVDFPAGTEPARVAALLVEETLRDPGALEVGHRDGLRVAVGLEEQALPPSAGMTLDARSVFVVTGAAGSIVSAITADLAAASGGTFHLLDLVPEPDRASEDLARFASDKEGLKRDVFQRLKDRGERATPALVEKEMAALERSHAALSAILAIERAGGTVRWYSGDLRDGARVAEIAAAIRAESGRVDVLLHGAGLEISRFLRDKEPREFDLVFDVKADGWFNLLSGLGDTPIGATVAFSSVAGRFGNGGQTDYSSANDLLCKTSSSFRTTRPATRGIAIDWTAWGDIGMATRGSIPKMMELAGIEMLPAAAGIPFVRRELTASAFAGELVAGKKLGSLTAPWDETGGLDAGAAAEAARALGPMVGRPITADLGAGLVVETTLDPKLQPFLFDHRIDGTPVLPGVMGIEAFAESAALLLPGWRVAAVEDVEFVAPFKLYRDEPRAVRVETVLEPAAGGSVVARGRLVGLRPLPGQAEPQATVHFRARVRLTREAPRAEVLGANLDRAASAASSSDVYKVYFHGPAYQVLEAVWKTESGVVGLLPDHLPPNHQPSALPTLMAPRLIELCFQTAGVLELGTVGKMGLPLRVASVSLLRAPETADGARLLAVVSPAAPDGSFDGAVVDDSGNVYLRVSGYRTVELPGGAAASDLAPFRAAMA